MTAKKFITTIKQIPVGQGGFLIGQIEDEHSRIFTYAFDCGSINREHFEQGLKMCALQKIDILFVSHLDVDHVSGIDALAAQVQIDMVVLPCLDALHLTMIACEAAGNSTLRLSTQSFLTDPFGWLVDRGVKEIIQVQRADDTLNVIPYEPDPEAQPDSIIVPVPEGGDPSRPYTIRSEMVEEAKSVRSGAGTVRTLGEHTSISVEVKGKSIPSWLLVPYVHPFPKEAIASFRRAVGKQFPHTFAGRSLASKAFTKKLIQLLSDKASCEELKACYSIISRDHNKISLSLYSGPQAHKNNLKISRTNKNFDWPFPKPYQIIHSEDTLIRKNGGAWICTGDANLNQRGTRSAWLKRFGKLLKNVDVFILPHHGSNDSIHDEVIKKLNNSEMIVCAAAGREKHPHNLLLGRLRSYESSLWHVSENPESGFTLKVSFSV